MKIYLYMAEQKLKVDPTSKVGMWAQVDMAPLGVNPSSKYPPSKKTEALLALSVQY